MHKIKFFLTLLIVCSINNNIFATKERVKRSEDEIAENTLPQEAELNDAHQKIEVELTSIPGLKPEDISEMPTLELEDDNSLGSTEGQENSDTAKTSLFKKTLKNYCNASDTGAAIVLGLLTWAKENIKNFKNLRKIYNATWKGHKKYRFMPVILIARIIAQFYGQSHKSTLNKIMLAFAVLAMSESEPANLIEDLFGEVAA